MGSVKEQIAGKYMIQCQKGEPFECPYLETCPHEDKDICQWQLDNADEILSLVCKRIEGAKLTDKDLKRIVPGYIDYHEGEDGEIDFSKTTFQDGAISKIHREIAQAQLQAILDVIKEE